MQSAQHPFSGSPNVVQTRDSLETILSQLSARVTNAIADGRCLYYLRYLLEFLAAWEERPVYLTPVAYRWCSAISEAARRLEIHTGYHAFGRLQLHNLPYLSTSAVEQFSNVGPGCDPLHSNTTSYRAHGHPYCLDSDIYPYLLCVALDIGFRRATSSSGQSTLRLDHTSHHEWAFEYAFSSKDDEVIADAVCVWIAGGDNTPPGSCAHYLAERVGSYASFSPRLRQASIYVIDRVWDKELEVSEFETVHWLNRLNIDTDDIVDRDRWAGRLVAVMRSPTGLESLSSHCWHLLAKLVIASKYNPYLVSRDTEVMRSLEEAEEWEKLGAWLVAVWSFLPGSNIPKPESMEGIEQVTLKSLLQQPSALPELEDLCESGVGSHPVYRESKGKLRRIFDQARVGHSPSESPPLYVSVHYIQHPSVLMLSFFVPDDWFTSSHSFPFFLQEMTVSETVYSHDR